MPRLKDAPEHREQARLTALLRSPAAEAARGLIGQVLVRPGWGEVRIVETEAYLGAGDPAAHAFRGRTPRTEPLWGPPGTLYVYLIYGMHHCFNVVADQDGTAAAVLVRGLEPLEGLEGLRTDGPGRLCRAMNITLEHYDDDLCGRELFLEYAEPVAARRVARGPRIGVDYAGEWAAKPYRFWVRDNPFVSRGV